MYGYAGAPTPLGSTSSTNTLCLVITNTGTADAANVRMQGTIDGATEPFSGSSTIGSNASAVYMSSAYFGPNATVEPFLAVSIRVTMGNPPVEALTWQGTVQNPFNKFRCTLETV
jgi:uncharacterized repeat protein (TIGR01451 family)